MGLRTLLWIVAVAVVAGAATTPAAQPAAGDGLAKVPCKALDEVYVRPGADLAVYRKAQLAPGRVEFERGWLKRMNETRDVTRWLTQDDAQRIAGDATVRLDAAVAAAFAAQGYEVVTAPGPGTLRLSPYVTELFVNAPDVPAPGIQRAYTWSDAGTATVHLDVHDAQSGSLLARVVDRSTATEVGRLDRATSVSNLFWFETMFRRSMANAATAIRTAATVP
jgi:hypothetical protein